MNTLLIAAALIVQDPAAAAQWSAQPPYKQGDAAQYAVKMAIEDEVNGATVNVEMNLHVKTAKKSDRGFEGSYGWTHLGVEGEAMDDETFTTVLKPNGIVKSVDSHYGPGMRRMVLPFYFAYPERPVAIGGTWAYKDDKADETDGHVTDFEYKLVGPEAVNSKKAHKVTVKFNEQGPAPLKGTGTYWIGEDGRVLKFDLDVTGWTVPVASQVFKARITGELKS